MTPATIDNLIGLFAAIATVCAVFLVLGALGVGIADTIIRRWER